MNRLAAVLLVLFLVGCGFQSASKSGGGAAKKDKPAKPQAKATPKITPVAAPEPKRPTVAANAYPDIPAAIAALLVVAEKGSQADAAERDERTKVITWLVQQKEAAVEPLAEKLADESVSLAGKIELCKVLGQIGPPAHATLKKAIDSNEQLIRFNAVKQLAAIKPMSSEVIKTIVGALEHSDPRTREQAVRSLGGIGPPAKEAAEPLLAILNSDADDVLRSEAKKALKSVNPRHTFKD